MTLKDLLKRKKKKDNVSVSQGLDPVPHPPKFTIIRSDTNTREIINPPSFASDSASPPCREVKRYSTFRNVPSGFTESRGSKGDRRLSSLFHLRSSSHESRASANLPTNLPDIDDLQGKEDKEAQWERRATILARENTNLQSSASFSGAAAEASESITNVNGNDDIQQAILLHESGDLVNSTAMFGRLAAQTGEENVLAQVLYGLALRHGWGISPNPLLAITYLSRAASNSASIESQALASGTKTGGAAKGELVLAIYELANCFRHGWGVGKDPIAARSYYETAANLGDTDAMNEVARCYEDGFGGKKDKFKAASYYRLAESKGNKIIGNSWIWKDKYNQKM